MPPSELNANLTAPSPESDIPETTKFSILNGDTVIVVDDRPFVGLTVAISVSPPPTAGAALAHVVPLLVSTLPFVPGATVVTALVPLPSSTLFAARDVAPVPPLATGSVPPVVTSVPPVVGSVSVLSLAVAGTSRVTEPPPEELSLTGMSYTTVHVLPEGTVTTAPEATVIGPNVPAFWPAGME